ncbi:MAG: SDR family NAD(P)-dependent oxidoreductase [Bacteroidales bacterium]
MAPKYFHDYQWSNIAAMIRNNRRDPAICPDDFVNRLVVITGATSGIGRLTARKFASRGADLLCINRSEEKSAALKEEIEGEFGVRCDSFRADLSCLEDARRVAEELTRIERPIDVLIHNAGVHLTRQERSAEGYDKVFVVHHLSPFVINARLASKLKAQEQARILLVSSEGHRFAAWGLYLEDLNWDRRRYSGLKSYGSAKLAQLLAMLVFEEYFRGSGVRINAMHPGAVRSETGKENGVVYRWFKRNLFDRMLRPTDIAAESLYYLAVSPEPKDVSGKFFNLTTLEEPAPPAWDREAARALWAKSLEMTGEEDIMETP